MLIIDDFLDNGCALQGLISIPFGFQHVLAMFVANIAPIMIVTGASRLSTFAKYWRKIIAGIFPKNCVAVVFIVAILLNLRLCEKKSVNSDLL